MTDPLRPYAAQHGNLNGPGDARPTAIQIVKDNDLIGKFSDKVAIVTGAASGIGIETARAIHETGAKVFLAVRDLKKGEEVKEDILKNSEVDGDVELLEVDLGNLESVRKAADEFKRRSDKLNLLINNAGVMAIQERTLTKEGHETQLAINHIGHFLLFELLKDLLISSSTSAFQSRVVNVTSLGHRAYSVDFDDITLEKDYKPFNAYGQSKTANIWMANYIDRVYGPQGVHALSVHPGGILTNLARHIDPQWVKSMMTDETTVRYVKNAEQGAATTVWAATGKVWEGKGGRYLEDCGDSRPARESADRQGSEPGYEKWAYDVEGENKLWEKSLEWTAAFRK